MDESSKIDLFTQKLWIIWREWIFSVYLPQRTLLNGEKNMLNEIYVAVKEIDYIEAKINALCEKYNSRHGNDYVQQRAW